jgi:hypothetical protein
MSHIPAIVAVIAEAARTAAETFGSSPGPHAVSFYPASRPEQVPLSKRPSHELRARAVELNRMAATASTADAKASLEMLAARFAGLAAQRELSEVLNWNSDSVGT